MDRRLFLSTSGASVLAALTAGCTGNIPSADGTPAPDSDEWQRQQDVDGEGAVGSAQSLIVKQHYFARAGDDAKVGGVVTNTSDDAAAEVTLTAKLYQEGDSFMSNQLDLEDGLNPDQNKQFNILFADVEDRTVDRYTIGTSRS